MLRDFIVFTDLDGTLLDHDTYCFKVVLPALELIKLNEIPLVICTSKTGAEIKVYRKLLQNNDPFVSENGGGIFIPTTYFSHDFSCSREENGYKVIELGTPHRILAETLNSIRRETGIKLKRFSEMTINEISKVSGLGAESVKFAKRREYDEPFLICGDQNDTEAIKFEIARRGFTYTEGGRFHHITGGSNKGAAVKILISLFKQNSPNLQTLAIGDSFNDLSMLEAVDTPILVKKPNGEYDSRIRLHNMVFEQGIGPVGWNNAVLNFLNN